MGKKIFIGFVFSLSCFATNLNLAPVKRVMIVVFENTNFKDALRQPFFNRLAKEGALFTKFYAETHPSQPNYLAMVSGSTQGCVDDSLFDTEALNLADRLTEKGISWKVYAEAFPGNCFLGKESETYVRKHNPFISFKSVQTDPLKCAKIVEASSLESDIENQTLPQFSYYIPDMNHDGHDTGVEYADRWYESKFAPLLKTKVFQDDLLLVTTFDESSLFSLENRIYTSFYGKPVRAGSVSENRYNHYNLLKTIEQIFYLEPMAENDKKASGIEGIWQLRSQGFHYMTF